jgi:hypothetical protein
LTHKSRPGYTNQEGGTTKAQRRPLRGQLHEHKGKKDDYTKQEKLAKKVFS